MKLIEIINGFVIKERLEDSTAKYYIAKRDNIVFTSNSLAYLRNKVKSYGTK